MGKYTTYVRQEYNIMNSIFFLKALLSFYTYKILIIFNLYIYGSYDHITNVPQHIILFIYYIGSIVKCDYIAGVYVYRVIYKFVTLYTFNAK